MKNFIGKVLFIISKKILAFFGYTINLGSSFKSYPELKKEQEEFCTKIYNSNLTLTSLESLKLLAITCNYIRNTNVVGDFVETGVWRGGSSIVAKYMLGDSKTYYLFDTFSGMTEPSNFDYRIGENSAEKTIKKWNSMQSESGNKWVTASIQEVEGNFTKFDLFDNKVKLIKGDVRFTLELSQNLPTVISILRIDTDFYDSTLISLKKLWPLLANGGVLILDDYAHWDGARRAVDEYFAASGLSSLLKIPIAGGGGRVVLKP
jgi:hypothetical protein